MVWRCVAVGKGGATGTFFVHYMAAMGILLLVAWAVARFAEAGGVFGAVHPDGSSGPGRECFQCFRTGAELCRPWRDSRYEIVMPTRSPLRRMHDILAS